MDETPLTGFAKIQQSVKQAVSNSNAAVLDKVANKLAGVTIDARIKAVEQAVTKITDAQKELNKIRGTKQLAEDGSVINVTFTQDQINQKKKLEELIQRGTTALTVYDESGDFDKLSKFVSGAPQPKEQSDDLSAGD